MSNSCFKICFPYRLEKQSNGKYRAYNGENNPVGFNTWDSDREEKLRKLHLKEPLPPHLRSWGCHEDRLLKTYADLVSLMDADLISSTYADLIPNFPMEISLKFTKSNLEKLACEKDPTEIYLYDLDFLPTDSADNMRKYMEKIETLLKMTRPIDRKWRNRYITELGSFFQAYFPYCIIKQDNGSYIFCNREYKPIGFNTWNYIRYEDFPVDIPLVFARDQIRKLSCKDDKITANWYNKHGTIYLYDSASWPPAKKSNMQKYLAKLEMLAHL